MGATSQDRLQAVVQKHIPDERSRDEFLYFHLSVVQKLWSVDWLAGKIAKLEPELVWGSEVYNDPERGQWSADIEEFGRMANLWLDCFLMNSMASLDTLAHEIKVLYVFGTPSKAGAGPDRLTIKTVRNDLVRHHPDRKLTKYLESQLKDDGWFGIFSMYRHCTTHESVIGSNIHLDIQFGRVREVKVPLPDDPRERPFMNRHRRELKPYCEKTTKNVRKLVDRSYQLILADIEEAKHVLPIPR